MEEQATATRYHPLYVLLKCQSFRGWEAKSCILGWRDNLVCKVLAINTRSQAPGPVQSRRGQVDVTLALEKQRRSHP